MQPFFERKIAIKCFLTESSSVSTYAQVSTLMRNAADPVDREHRAFPSRIKREKKNYFIYLKVQKSIATF